MTTNQASFRERCRRLDEAAAQLKAIAQIVSDEALRMTAAAERFAERQKERTRR